MNRYARVHGVIYECTLVYAQDERLDPLAELVYDGLRHERDIERLSNAFGLPANLIDSILVDLARRGFAVLDIMKNQFLRVETPSARPVYRESRTERVWHDLHTGGIVVARRVRRFAARPDDPFEEVVLAPPPSGVTDFFTLSNSQIISQIVRREPALEWEEGRQWRLDRIVSRQRVEGRPLWFKVQQLDLFGEAFELIQEEDVPVWMSRSWTNALARKRDLVLPTIVPVGRLWKGAAAPSEPSQDGAFADDLLAATSVARTLARWSSTIVEAIDRSPRPLSAAELMELRQAEAMLTKVVESRVHVELGLGSMLANLAEASRSVLLVLDSWHSEVPDAIAKALSSLKSRREFVDVGVLVPGGRERLIPALLSRGVDDQVLLTRLVIDELREGVRCSCVILDECEVRLAGVRTMFRDRGWVKFSPSSGGELMIVREMRAAVGTLCRTAEFGDWVRQRSTERAHRRTDADVLDRPPALTARVYNLVYALSRASVRDDEVKSLRSVAEEEAGHIDALVTDVRVSVERHIEREGSSACRNLDPPERLEVLMQALDHAQRDGSAGVIVLGVRAVGALARDHGFLAAIRGVVGNGWRLELAAPPEVAHKLLEVFSEGQAQAVVTRYGVRPPFTIDLSVLAVRDWVCLSTRDWLDADVGAPCWTVLIERKGLLDELAEAPLVPA